TCAICARTWKRAAPCSSTTATSPSWRSFATTTAITSRARSARTTPISSSRGYQRSGDDLPQLRLRRLFRRGRPDLLATAPPPAESAAGRRQLRLLRLRAPLVRHARVCDDGCGLLGGARDGIVDRAAAVVHGAEPGGKPRTAGPLQVLQ